MPPTMGLTCFGRILVIDDDTDLREALSEFLELEGYTVTQAVNGREGWEKLQEQRPDAVLLDLHMPVLDGWDWLELRNRDPGASSIPVIVTSADNRLVDAERYERVYVLRKPYFVERLLGLLKTVVLD